MKAFVISLMRRTDRCETAWNAAREAGLDFEIVEAIDGHSFRSPGKDHTDWKRVRRKYPHNFSKWGGFKPSEIGCYFTHMEVYKRMLEQKLESAIILEDDFLLTPAPYGFHDVAREIGAVPDWLHCCLHDDRPGLNPYQKIVGNPHPMFNRVRETPLSTLAYAASQRFALYMLKYHKEMDLPVDQCICRISANPHLLFLQTTHPITIASGSPTTQE